MMSLTAAALVADAETRVRGYSPARVEAHLLAQDAVLIDLREPDEVDDDGLIAGAFQVPRGLLEFWADPASPSYRPPFDPSARTIVYSAAGSRSALAADTLQRLGYRDVAHLVGGLAAWRRAGLPVAGIGYGTQTPAPIPVPDGGPKQRTKERA
jgi:rhodanese-related sulfurtransferase